MVETDRLLSLSINVIDRNISMFIIDRVWNFLICYKHVVKISTFDNTSFYLIIYFVNSFLYKNLFISKYWILHFFEPKLR